MGADTREAVSKDRAQRADPVQHPLSQGNKGVSTGAEAGGRAASGAAAHAGWGTRVSTG